MYENVVEETCKKEIRSFNGAWDSSNLGPCCAQQTREAIQANSDFVQRCVSANLNRFAQKALQLDLGTELNRADALCSSWR